jgi:hypothetical protein
MKMKLMIRMIEAPVKNATLMSLNLRMWPLMSEWSWSS